MALTRPCRCGRPECPLCHLAENDPRYRKLWNITTDATPPTPSVCRHRSTRPVPVRQAIAQGLPHPTRMWFVCEHPDRPLPGTVVRDGRAYVCLCQGCGPACPGFDQDVDVLPVAAAHTIVLRMTAAGIGDGIQGVAVVTAVRQAWPDRRVVYQVGRQAVPFVRLFAGCETAEETGTAVDDGATVIDLNHNYDHEIRSRGRILRLVRYAANASVAVPPPTAYRLADPSAVTAAGADYRDAVVLCPHSSARDREYSLTGWLELSRRLRSRGHRVAAILDPDRTQRYWLLQDIAVTSRDPLRVAGILANAACVVGVDTGLTHLAAAVGTPTVVLTGPTTIDIFRLYHRTIGISGPFSCRGCYWHAPWHPDDCQRCGSLWAIDPTAVERAVEECVRPPIAVSRTLLDDDKRTVLRRELIGVRTRPGDLAEVGVYRGGSAYWIAAHGGPGTLHLFDTFRGLPADDPDGVHRTGEFAASQEDVATLLRPFTVRFYPGVFPETASALPSETRFRFVHIDADTYAATAAAIRAFTPRMVPGGVMVVDDFEWDATPGVTRAVRELRGEMIERGSRYQAVLRF